MASQEGSTQEGTQKSSEAGDAQALRLKEIKMAKKEPKSKIVLERTYNVPLRKEFLKVPKYKKSKKAITALRKFLKRHMKSDIIKIGKHLNELVWSKGIKNPPHHVHITAIKEDDGTVRAELVGKPVYEEKKEEPKKPAKPKEEKKDDKKEQKEDKVKEAKKAEKPVEDKKVEPVEDKKAEKKSEKKEEKPKEDKKVVPVEDKKAKKKSEKKEEKPKEEKKVETVEDKKPEPKAEKKEEKPKEEKPAEKKGETKEEKLLCRNAKITKTA